MKYFAILTNLGAAKLANATALGTTVDITHMAVGDGGGKLPTPDTNQTKLINEKRRAAINTLSVDPVNTSQIIAEQIIPENEGGWWVREIGLFDSEGVMIAVANCPETYKPQLQEGSGRTQAVRIVLIVSSTDTVTLKIDPSVVLATREYVDSSIKKHEKSRNHPDATTKDKGFVKLNSATDSNDETTAATSKAVKTAYDLAASKLSSVPDATLSQKGVVQLNNATNNASETQAATPKAVKIAYDLATTANNNAATANTNATNANNNANDRLAKNQNGADIPDKNAFVKNLGLSETVNLAQGAVPGSRKVNGKTLAGDIDISSQDIFDGQAIAIPEKADLNDYQTPGLYYQVSTAQAISGKSYPEGIAGSLVVLKGNGVIQRYYSVGSTRAYIRGFYHGYGWSPWAQEYNTLNKPTASELGLMGTEHINEHTALAVNKNASLTDLAGTAPQQLPVGMGLHAGGDFWAKFDIELIEVKSGVDPVIRPSIVRELLQYMDMDTLHFHGNFNIMKLAIKKTADGFGPYVFHIPNQHIPIGCFMSFVLYYKIVGNADWSWCDNTVKGRWHQHTHHLFTSNTPGRYVHVDIGVGGKVSIGDALYIALPQIITGKWNPSFRCPQLFNIGSGLGS